MISFIVASIDLIFDWLQDFPKMSLSHILLIVSYLSGANVMFVNSCILFTLYMKDHLSTFSVLF